MGENESERKKSRSLLEKIPARAEREWEKGEPPTQIHRFSDMFFMGGGYLNIS